MAEDDPRIVAITAAMAQGTALDRFGDRFPERLFDVGIAEQHALAFSTGLAKSGMRPVAAIYSTFLQRAYDQVFHEVCLQDMPVVFAIDRAGITGGDGATAQGNFDIAYLRTLPQISIMAPRNGSELNLMMRYALESTGPIAIRYPRESIPTEELDDVPAPIEHGRGELLRDGEDLALFALGAMVIPALEAAEALEEEGISTAVINARFAKPVDWRLLEEWCGRVPMLVTLEDHALQGGFGSAVLETASDHRLDLNKIRRIGIPDRFIEHGSRAVLMEKLGLDARGISNSIRKFLRASASQDTAVVGPDKA
jgi:1-deoxy-D-xylulose-5-phosphate synthase